MSQQHSEYAMTAVERAFLQAQLQELRGKCLGLDDIRALYEQHEVLSNGSPTGYLRLGDLRAARRDSGAGALILGCKLTDRGWASVLESIACADADQPVNADLFLRIFFEVQLLRARGGGGRGWTCPEPSETRIKMAISEVTFYIRHINASLADDPSFKDILPIGMLADELVDVAKEGVLLCKLINLAVPDTIDERVINSGRVLSEEEKMQNHALCIMSAMAIGCTTNNINTGDLAKGRPDVVLELISQIIKIQMLAGINLKSMPELIELAEDDEDLENLVRMSSENILLKWINYILKKQGFSRRISNFSSDLKDCVAYAYLLSILTPECELKISAMLRVGLSRAQKVLDAVSLLGCNVFLTPTNILDGLPNLNIVFVAHIFRMRNGLSNRETLKCFEVHVSSEEKFFQLWIKSLQISTSINNVFEDLRDGWILLEIADKMSPGSVDWSKANPQPGKQRSKVLENCKQVLKIVEKLRFCLPKNSENYIAQGSKMFLLNLLWQMKQYSMLEKLRNLGFQSSEMEIHENDILLWANKRVEKSSKSSAINSFQDKSLSDGIFFLSLLSTLGPQFVNWSYVSQGGNEQDKKLNAHYVISVARKYGCSVFLVPEDILDVNEKMMLSLTASILSRHLEKTTSQSLEHENECLSSNGGSHIFCSEDSDFVLEPVGQAGRKRFILPRAAYVPLLEYQKESMRWFWRLHCEGNGGILADDMGLGKTRQVVVFLLGLFHSQLIHRALIVAPPTLLDQWEKELLDQGLPTNVMQYYGGLAERYGALQQITEAGGILLTTYDLIRIEHQRIKGDSAPLWDYIITDEGHLIKNSRTKIFEALLKIPCNHRIVVSGTPVQNRTEELWTLFKFCHPNLLPGWKEFKSDYSSPMLKGNYKDSTNNEVLLSSKASRKLRHMIKPYILRREKELLVQSGVLGNVPLGNKTEIVVWLKLTPFQISLYEKQIKLYQLFRKKNMTNGKKKKSATFVTARLLQKISNHPLQISKKDKDIEDESESESDNGDEIRDVEVSLMDQMVSQLQSHVPVDDTVTPFTSSCKLKFIMELLEKLFEPKSEHRVLIFSQTTQMLDAIEDILCTVGYEFLRIDGKTMVEDRTNIVKRFSDALGPPILLLSSRVGGLGLNLTAADRVIIADPSWNPSVDAQSVDRVYRLGQRKHIHVYRLIAGCTIEEKMYQEQVSKTSIYKGTSEERNLKRYIFRKRKNDFFTLPRKGWAVSETQMRFERESKGYELDQESSAHVSFLEEKNIIGVSIHSMLFKQAIPLPTNIVESGDIKSFRTATSYRRQSSSDIIKNAQHLARHPKDFWSFEPPCSSSVSIEKLDTEITNIECKINDQQDELKVLSNLGKEDEVKNARERIAQLEAVLKQLRTEKQSMASGT